MDRTGIIVVTLCAILLVYWFVEQQKYAAQQQARYAATNQVAKAQSPSAAANSNVVSPTLTVTTTAVAPVFDTNTPEALLVITNAHARYTFTSRGGGLKSVELLDYPETVSPRWKKKVANDGVATLNTHAPIPVLAILGDASLVGDGYFTLTPITDGVHAEKSLTNGLRLSKEFHLGSNYLVNASVRLENISDQPFTLPAQEWVIGTATPMGPDDTSYTMNEGAIWFNGMGVQDQTLGWFSGSGFGCVRGAPRSEYLAGSNNVVWAAVHNQFFALMAMPKEPVAQIVARTVTLPPFPNVEPVPDAPALQGIQTALVYPSATLAAHQAIERQIVLFAGPKEYRLLARIGDQFQNQADLVMQFGKFTGFFAKALLLAMNWLHDVTRAGYGLTIVLITVIIKVVFWPLTAASTRSMKRMQVLAPEMAALKEKYKDDMQKFTQKQWELYRKHKVSPMSGCLPMAIQMPVFFGFYTMIRSAIELRGARFLWIADLSKPDTLFMIPGTHFPFNLLPLLMGGSMLWQSHLTPPSPGMDPTQAKMMRYMPLMFLVFLYNFSSGLALYWTVNNVLTVIQTKLTKMNQPPVAPAAVSVLTPASKKKK
ncbi:MAG: membrane protein insertase YidC [Verrucomicrobiota bacterium]|jgi:YidC/Oxa1 family membrane protein insertase